MFGLITAACNPGTTADSATLGDSAGASESSPGSSSVTEGAPTSGLSASNSEGPDGTASHSESDTNITASDSASVSDSSASMTVSASDGSAGTTGAATVTASAGDSAGTTGSASDGSAGTTATSDASTRGGTDPSDSAGEGGDVCKPTVCDGDGQVHACGDCDDNDGDEQIDCADPDCFGPCDDSEAELGSPLEDKDPCKQDCYFDGDGGQGGGDCQWNLKCDPLGPDPKCPYNGWEPDLDAPLDLGQCVDGDAASCMDHCSPPKGCDCFGCCVFPNEPDPDVDARFIGSPGCTVDAPGSCAPCTQQQWCINPCEDGVGCFPDPEQSECPAPQ